jgi:hypothetical protein
MRRSPLTTRRRSQLTDTIGADKIIGLDRHAGDR